MNAPIELLCQLRDQVEKKAVQPPKQIGDDSWQGVAFVVDNQQLLVNMKEISEVIEMPDFTSLPGVQPWIVGLANVRGMTLPLVDLGVYLDKEASRTKSRCHLISLDRPDTKFGLIVDQIIGMRQVSNQNIEPVDESHELQNYLSGKVDIAGEAWHIFDTDRLIFSDRFRQVAAA